MTDTEESHRQLSLLCSCGFLVWAWLGMSNMDYEAGSMTSGMTTAFYFYVGLPILCVIGYFSTIPFKLLSRSFGASIGYVAATAFYALVIGFTYSQSTPHARMNWALKTKAPPGIKLHRLVQRDSFNDGFTVWGIADAPKAFVSSVVDRENMSTTVNSDVFRLSLDAEDLPEYGIGYKAGLLQIFFDERNSKLYFARRSREPTP